MKELYEKPSVEFVSFETTESIMDVDIGDEDVVGSVEDW